MSKPFAFLGNMTLICHDEGTLSSGRISTQLYLYLDPNPDPTVTKQRIRQFSKTGSEESKNEFFLKNITK